MKIKFIAMLAFLSIALTSCELGDDDSVPVRLEIIPITSVEIPDPFVFGEVNEIIVRYNNPSDCYRFLGFNVDSDLNERVVAVVAEVFDDPSCTEENLPTEQTLRFLATSNGTIEFKFYSGLDASGEEQFLEFSVMVQE